MIDIVHFLVAAKRNTYAKNTGQTTSSRLGSYDLEYREGDFIYRDSYIGTHSFSGQEIVWYQQAPVWSMNYYGDVLHERFKSKFLKTSLLEVNAAFPYRGQPFYQAGDYTYTMAVDGDFNKFTGKEKILFKEQLVYELFFHGGKIIDKHFD